MSNIAVMYERESDEMWERFTEPDEIEEKLYDCTEWLQKANDAMNNATDYLASAIEVVDGTVAEDKITSLLNDLEDLRCCVSMMCKNFKKGVV